MSANDEWDNATAAPPVHGRNGERRRKARLTGGPLTTGDRLPPASEEAEQAVLGCALLDPVASLTECLRRRVVPEQFYVLKHRSIYEGLLELFAGDKLIEVLTLQQHLKDRNELEGVGGLAFLDGLKDATPSAVHLPHYLDILQEKFTQRRLITLCVEAVARVYDPEERVEIEQVLDEFQRDAFALADATVARQAAPLRELMPAVIDDLEDGYHRGHAQIKGLTTGLDYLDKILCGIGGKHGNGIVLAARPGVGKSALAMQIAAHVAMDYEWFTPQRNDVGQIELDPATHKPRAWDKHRGLPVGVFSLEMSAEELLRRLLFLRSGVDAQRFKTGFAAKGDDVRLVMASKDLVKAPIYIDDDDGLTIDALMARARAMVRQHGIRLFIVDYIQCLQVAQKRFRQDRVQEMAEISNGLRRLGKQLNVPFLVLAQMNRDFAKEKGVRKPRLEDLRDSGSIEQDAHVVMFLYEDENEERQEELREEWKGVYRPDEDADDWSGSPKLMKLLVAKNRHGMNNKSSELIFDGSCTRFVDRFVWKKANGLKAAAKGERRKKTKRAERDMEMPTDEELGMEGML